MANAIHLIPKNRSLRRLGLKGDVAVNLDEELEQLVFVGLKDHDTFVLTFDAIERALVGQFTQGRTTRYRTLIYRSDGGRRIVIDGRFPTYYPDFITHLAEALEQSGRRGRIWGGTPFLDMSGPFFLVMGLLFLAGGAYALLSGEITPTRDGLLMLAMIAGAGLLNAGFGLHHLLTREWPRPIRDLADLPRFLP